MRARPILIVTLVCASACSGSPPVAPDATSIVARAADKARSRHDATYTTTIGVTFAKPPPAIVRGQGIIDFSARVSSATVDVRALLGAFDARAGAPARLEFLFTPAWLYLKLEPPRGAHEWARISASVLSGPSGGNPFAQLGGSDPGVMLDILRGVRSGARSLGVERLGNVRTTKYEATIDLSRAAALGGSSVAGWIHQQFRTAKTVTATAWIDTLGLARRIALTSGASATTFRIDLGSYGAAPTIRTPADAQVVKLRSASELSAIFAAAFAPA